MCADPCCQGERDERQAGHERARAEDVLEIDRAEEEEAEHRAGGREHQDEAAADRAIGEPADLSGAASRGVSRTANAARPGQPATTKASVCAGRPAGAAPWVIA